MAYVYFLNPHNPPDTVIVVDDSLASTNDPAWSARTVMNTDADYLAWAAGKTPVDYTVETVLTADYGALSGSFSPWKVGINAATSIASILEDEMVEAAARIAEHEDAYSGAVSSEAAWRTYRNLIRSNPAITDVFAWIAANKPS